MKKFVLYRVTNGMYYKKENDPRYYKVLKIVNKLEIEHGTSELLVTIATSDNLSQCEVVETIYDDDEFYLIEDGKSPVKMDMSVYTTERNLSFLLRRCLGYDVKIHSDDCVVDYVYVYDGKSATKLPIDELGIIFCDLSENTYRFMDGFECPTIYNSEEDVYKWNSYFKVDDGKETEIPGKFSIFMLNDDQKKLVDELVKLSDKMKAAGIKVYYDYTCGGTYFANKLGLNKLHIEYRDDIVDSLEFMGYDDFVKLTSVDFSGMISEEQGLAFERK